MWSQEVDILERFGYVLKSCEAGDFFEVVSFIQDEDDKRLTQSEIRKQLACFESNHERYFMLFHPGLSITSKDEQPLQVFQRDLTLMKNNRIPPQLRDIYALSDFWEINITLLTLPKGKSRFKGLRIEPTLKNSSACKRAVILMKMNDGKPIFQLAKHQDASCDTIACDLWNDGHTHCHLFDKRFRNDLQIFTKDYVEDHTPNKVMVIGRSSSTPQNLFTVLATEIYDDKHLAKFVKITLRDHMSNELYCDVYARFIHHKKEVPSDQEKQVNKAKTLTEKDLFEQQKKDLSKHLDKWESITSLDFYAVASIYNCKIFVTEVKEDETRTSLYLPICNSFSSSFMSPLFLHKTEKSNFYTTLLPTSIYCTCQQREPIVRGEFPFLQNSIEERMEREIKSCCPPKSRHGAHGHFSHVPGFKTKQDEITLYSKPWSPHLENIFKHLESIRLRVDQINGGEGTLEMCICKEIYGIDNEEGISKLRVEVGDIYNPVLPMEYLQRVTNHIRIPIFVLSSSEFPEWIKFYPEGSCANEKQKKCRYYITLLHTVNNKQREYFDRIVPIRGCNCQRTSPIATKMTRSDMAFSNKKDVLHKSKKHMPLVSFLNSEPSEELFSDEIRASPSCLPCSEIPILMSRPDMKYRKIDKISDYSFSLFRCISKDIFGNEDSFKMVRDEIVKEIIENPSFYGPFMRCQRSKSEDKDEEREFFNNFRFRRGTVLDLFKFKRKIEKEEAEFYAHRIEDGLELEDLELLAAATCFQTNVYVLSFQEEKIDKKRERMWTEWKVYEKIRVKRRPLNLNRRHLKCSCVREDNGHTKFYLTVYKTFAGHFHRIVSSDVECNCLLPVPDLSQIFPADYETPDLKIFNFMRRIENRKFIAEQEFDNFLRYNRAFELLCVDLIDELEGRRRNANIAGIVGSSIGLAGTIIAVVGIAAVPATMGASLGLTIAGTVVGGLGGLTSTGSKIGEHVKNIKPNAQFARYRMNVKERGRCLAKSFTELQNELEKMMNNDSGNLEEVPDATARIFRTFMSLADLPLLVLRVLSRAIIVAEAIVLPVSGVLDTAILVHSAYNLYQGSQTGLSKQLRKLQCLLKSARIQMFVRLYGNQKQLPNFEQLYEPQ